MCVRIPRPVVIESQHHTPPTIYERDNRDTDGETRTWYTRSKVLFPPGSFFISQFFPSPVTLCRFTALVTATRGARTYVPVKSRSPREIPARIKRRVYVRQVVKKNYGFIFFRFHPFPPRSIRTATGSASNTSRRRDSFVRGSPHTGRDSIMADRERF